MDSSKEKYIKEQLNEALQCTYNSKNEIKQKAKEIKDEETKEKECHSKGAVFLKFTADTELRTSLGKKSFERIKDIFEKTETMKEVAKEKNEQLEEQFKFLKQKLSSSSEYLLRIKKNIENIKFSYQKNVLEMHNVLDPTDILLAKQNAIKTKEDMAKHMEDIRMKIEELQTRMTAQREKHQHVTESYQAAFDRVVNTLQQIEEGTYSSQDIFQN